MPLSLLVLHISYVCLRQVQVGHQLIVQLVWLMAVEVTRCGSYSTNIGGYKSPQGFRYRIIIGFHNLLPFFVMQKFIRIIYLVYKILKKVYCNIVTNDQGLLFRFSGKQVDGVTYKCHVYIRVPGYVFNMILVRLCNCHRSSLQMSVRVHFIK